MGKNICFNPPTGATTLLVGINAVGIILAFFGVILTQYKVQFYVESDVTQGMYYAASLFLWVAFLLSLAHICFGLMQRKHIHRVSADYPEIDLRTGKKGKYLLAAVILSGLGMAAGLAAGIYGLFYMETRRAITSNWTLDQEFELAGDGNVLMLSITQTISGSAQTWKDVQDRLACCSWSNVTDEYATGYCCTNADKSCPDSPVGCREPWLADMWLFNAQVCALLLVVGVVQLVSTGALIQLRFCSRSSLFKYSAYGASLETKRLKERAMSMAVTQSTMELAAKAARESLALDDDAFQEQDLAPLVDATVDETENDDKDNAEAEKEPLTGEKVTEA